MLLALVNHEWKSLRFDGNLKISSVSLASDYMPTLDSLKTLDLTDCYLIDDEAIHGIATKCPNLTNLTLANCFQVTQRGTSSMKENLRLLEDVDMTGCYQIDDNSIIHFAEMQSLQFLNLACCDGITWEFGGSLPTIKNDLIKSMCLRSINSVTDKAVGIIVQMFVGLRILDLSFSSRRLTDASLRYISESPIAPTLFSLNMWSSDITDDGLKILTSSVTSLRALTLSGCSRLTEESMISIIARLKGLTTLNIWGCSNISGASIHLFLRYYSNLKTFGLSYCDLEDYAISGLEKSTSLRALELDGCNKLTDNGIKDMGSHELQALYFKRCTRISPEGIKTVTRKSPNISTINFTDVRLEERDLEEILTELKHLSRITLSGIHGVNLSTVTTITQQCGQLIQVVKLDSCPNLDDECVQLILKLCPHLKEISFMFCDKLTDNAFLQTPETIFQYNLRDIYLGGCINVTGESIKHLARLSPKLRNLSIPMVASLTDDVFIEFTKYTPLLDNLNITRAKTPLREGIEALSTNCIYMKNLTISNTSLDSACLDYIKELKYLNTLDMSNCYQFSEESILDVIRECKILKTLRLNCQDHEKRLTNEFFEEAIRINKELHIQKDY